MTARAKWSSGLWRASFTLAATCLAAVAGVEGCAVQVDSSEPFTTEEVGEVREELTHAMSREEILALAQSGVGYSYWWGGGRWDPSSKAYPGKCSGSCGKCSHSAYPKGGAEYGADCSGFVAQVWQVPTEQSPKINRHPYSTYNFRWEKSHWYPIKKSELKPGDALVYNTKSKGHIALFDGWTSGGKAMAYECAGCKIGCVHKPRSFGSYYIAIRRNSVGDEPKATPPKGTLDKAACDTGIQGWAQDPDAPKAALDVILTFDGPITSKNVKKVTVKAELKRDDLCKKLGSCEHAFDVPMPSMLADGKKHSVYAYAVNSTGKGQKLLVGAPRSFKCDTSTPPPANDVPSTCGHGECSTGAALTKDCSPCASAVCLIRPSCCDPAAGSWDASCVDIASEMPKACRGVCAGAASSCAHSECEAGTGLSASCSPCAAHVCKRDPYCCSSDKWDWICAKEAKEDPWCSCGL